MQISIRLQSRPDLDLLTMYRNGINLPAILKEALYSYAHGLPFKVLIEPLNPITMDQACSKRVKKEFFDEDKGRLVSYVRYVPVKFDVIVKDPEVLKIVSACRSAYVSTFCKGLIRACLVNPPLSSMILIDEEIKRVTKRKNRNWDLETEESRLLGTADMVRENEASQFLKLKADLHDRADDERIYLACRSFGDAAARTRGNAWGSFGLLSEDLKPRKERKRNASPVNPHDGSGNDAENGKASVPNIIALPKKPGKGKPDPKSPTPPADDQVMTKPSGMTIQPAAEPDPVPAAPAVSDGSMTDGMSKPSGMHFEMPFENQVVTEPENDAIMDAGEDDTFNFLLEASGLH